MIAEIYPLTRMPRRFGVFDYEIPEGMEVTPGMWVRIPFRSQKPILGIVARIKDIPPRGIVLKSILEVVEMHKLSNADLSWYEVLAHDTAQSISSVLYTSLPSVSKRSPTTPETPPPHRVLTFPPQDQAILENQVSALRIRGEAWIESPDLFRMTCVVAGYRREHADRTILVLCPNVSDAKRAWLMCGMPDALLVTGDETPRARRNTWSAWRTQRAPILFGTRVAALWHRQDIAAVFVLRSGHANHKQADRNPRFDARTLALSLRPGGTNAYFLDSSLRSDDLMRFSPTNRIAFDRCTSIRVVDRASERAAAPHPAISYSAADLIAQTLDEGKHIICAYNKKGSALRLRCHACRAAVRCDTCQTPVGVRSGAGYCGPCRTTRPIPTICSACGAKEIRNEGYGNESIVRTLQALFPDTSVALYDKEHTDPSVLTNQIIVTTRAWLENVFNPFQPESNVGVVIELDADAPLYDSSFRSTESAVRNVLEWRGVAQALHATFSIQTDTPALFYRIAENPTAVLAEDLETRRAYGYPPFRRIIAVRYISDEPRDIASAYASLGHSVREVISEAKIQTNNAALFISIPTEKIEKLLVVLHALDDHYVIDTNLG